jgi:hypothetical protein
VSNGTGRIVIYAIGAQATTTGATTFTGSAVAGFTKISEQTIASSTAYSQALAVYEKTGQGAATVTPAVPTWSPTTPTAVSRGGHGLVIIY